MDILVKGLKLEKNILTQPASIPGEWKLYMIIIQTIIHLTAALIKSGFDIFKLIMTASWTIILRFWLITHMSLM